MLPNSTCRAQHNPSQPPRVPSTAAVSQQCSKEPKESYSRNLSRELNKDVEARLGVQHALMRDKHNRDRIPGANPIRCQSRLILQGPGIVDVMLVPRRHMGLSIDRLGPKLLFQRKHGRIPTGRNLPQAHAER